MNQQPNSGQNFDSNDSEFRKTQIGQAGGNLRQIQNINPSYSVLNLAGFLRPREINISDKQDYKSRQILLNKVKQYWITQVLEKSLHSKALIELGLEERLDAVKRPSEIAQENESNLRKQLPQDKNNIDVFREMPQGRTLLILGEPGAGKTTFMLRITKNLIADTEQNLSLPIPVIFNLSSWANKRQNITQWLIQELKKNYKVSKSLAKIWIQNQQLLLMLDGLDEVKAEYRDACVQALNEFMRNYGETEIIVCSRVKDYESLTNRLAIQRGVCIQSLTTEQINDYLDRAGNQLQAVKTLLETDKALQELVKSPLILSIITFAYRDVAIEYLPKVDSIEEHRQYLFDKYIQRMFQRRGTNKVYSEEKARHWLSWLAYQMSQNSQTIFSIESMQPRLLANGWQKLIYRIGTIVFTSIFFTFISLLLAILIPKAWTLEEEIARLVNYIDELLLIGLLIGFTALINTYLGSKEEIILPLHRWKFSIKKAFEGLIHGIKIGIISGSIIGIYFIIDNLVNPYDWGLEYYFFRDRVIALILSLAFGILFSFFFITIQKIFSFSKIYHTNKLFGNHLKIYIKNIVVWGIFIGIFIWTLSLIFHHIMMDLIVFCIFIIFVFIIIFSLPFGIIGAVFGSRNSSDIQKDIVAVNYLRKALINTTISGVTGCILGVSISILYILLTNDFSLTSKDNSVIIASAYILGISFGFITGFACIKHFSLRFILYRYNYIAWKYTNFLDYATERIFLQKVGGGYIFVHRLLLEHFAALYQNPQKSLASISNLSRTRNRKVFPIFLVGITTIITFFGYQFRNEAEKFVQHLDDPNRIINYYTQQIHKNPKNAKNYDERGIIYKEKGEYDLAIADYTKAIQLDPKYDYAYNGRGIAYYNKKQYDLAIADYTQAIKLDSKNKYAYNNRGFAYKDKGIKNQAIRDFKKVIELTKNKNNPEDRKLFQKAQKEIKLLDGN